MDVGLPERPIDVTNAPRRLRDPAPRPGASHVRGTIVLGLVPILALALAARPAAAQEPPDLPYTVTIAPTGDSRLDAAAQAVSQLVALRSTAPTSGMGILGRAQLDADRLQTALRSEGYYAGTVRITIAGEPLDAADLIDRIGRMPAPLAVAVTLTPGPVYRIRSIAMTADPAGAAPLAAAAGPLGIAVGDPARAAPVLDAAEDVLTRLRRAGHPLAAIAARDVVVDHDRHDMEIAWRFAPGPRARFAAPQVTGAERTDQALLGRIAARRLAGRDYSPERLERARRALLGLGPFGSVRAEAGQALDAAGDLPVTFAVRERQPRAIGATVAYETNYGPTIRAYWEHRNLFGGAERLRLEGEVARLGDASLQQVNYRVMASYRQPEFLMRDIQMTAQIGAVIERLDAYDRDVALASLIFEHPLAETLLIQAGPGYEVGRVGRDGDWMNVNLASLTLGMRYDGTDNLLNPTRGWRVSATLTPFLSLGDGQSFARLQTVASTYWNVSGDGGSVLALRASIGSAIGAARDDLPFNHRFYAGGGGSVRGFPYLGIGPRDAVNRPLGGASAITASVEWRQRITGNWGVVAFADAGSVSAGAVPGLSDVRIGVGAGVRYMTAIGPLRLDIGVPLNREPGGPILGAYVGIGQAF